MDLTTAVLGVVTLVAVILAVVAWRQSARARRSIAELHDYDPLTRLPNRNRLTDRLNELLVRSRQTTSKIAVIAIELTRFEYLNEAYGHEIGDALMVAAAKQLRQATLTDELLIRYGGPQFVVVVPECPDPSQGRKRAESLLTTVGRTYEVGRDRIRLHACAGLALTSQQYIDAEGVLLDAQIALRHATDKGRGSLSIFDASMRNQFSPSAAEHSVREALERGRFRLLYLPVVDLQEDRMVGAEALLRWADPDAGLVSPGHFLRTLDETGLIVPVGTWVIGEAARQAAEWHERHSEHPIEVTVNVSPRQMRQSDFVDMLIEAVAVSGVDPQLLCIEVSESALIRDVDEAWTILRQVKQNGLRLALDDFGTGQSSLAHLRRFKLDRLKIDRTFVAGMVDNPEDAAIVRHLVGLAHALGMQPIAEGVETGEQAAALGEADCRYAQGWFFADAQPPHALERLLGSRGLAQGPGIRREGLQPQETDAPIVRPDLS